MASDAETQKKNPTVFGFIWRGIESSRAVFARANANDWFRLFRGISCPSSFREATQRMRHNLRDFSPNYMVLMLLMMVVSVLLKPWNFLTLFGIVVTWHYVINVRNKDLTIGEKVLTVRLQGVVILIAAAIVICFFTSFSTTFITCVSVAAGICGSHSLMKALDEEQANSDVDNSESQPSLLAEFSEYSASISSGLRGAGFEKVIPNQVFEYGRKANDSISSYFGQALSSYSNQKGSAMSNATTAPSANSV